MSTDISGGGQESVASVTESQGPVESVQSAQPTQAKESAKGPGPWQKDLESLGLGDEYTRIVDGYLREKWQPRVTELEQQFAPYKELFQSPDDGTAASELLYSLRENPRETYKLLGEMIEEAFGPEQADELMDQLEDVQDSGEPDERQAFIDQLMQEREFEAQMKEYQSVVDKLKGDAPDLNEQWFAKLVVANNGDTDAAFEDYKELFADQFKSPEPPPPTVGDGPMAPQESEEFDGDLEALVRNVVRRSNAKK